MGKKQNNVNNLFPKIIYPSLRNKAYVLYSYYTQPTYLVLITRMMSLNVEISCCIVSRTDKEQRLKINKEVRIKTIIKIVVSALQIVRQI